MRVHPFATLAVMTVAVLTLSAGTSAGQTPRVRVSRVSQPPRLDDFIEGRIPAGMAKVTGFVQREPRDGEPVSRDTTVYLGYDEKNFYAVFVCVEDPGNVRAHMARREAIEGDDQVALYLDTFRDRRHAYGFVVNPLGIQMDAVMTDGQDDDFSFDTVWHSGGRLTPQGYAVYMAIPFKSLRFADADVHTWGVAMARTLPTRNEISFWPRITRNISSQIAQAADLEGLERISPGRNLQFIPYGAFTGSRYLDEADLAYGRKKEGRAGLDAKVVVKDALTLDVAVNPDFSQVESDEPQVTINQRFEVQFPEKRPFFLENASYFSTPEELFFSRRIADPSLGIRLTGRVGKWTVGGLVMDDRAPGELAPEGSAVRGDSTVAAVGRAVREFAQQSTFGVMLTSRDFGPSSNRLASADVRLRLGNNWIVTGQAIASSTTALDGTAVSGPAYHAGAAYESRSVRMGSNYTDRSPGFRSQLGFIPRSDVRLWESEVGYTFFPKGKTVLSWGPQLEASVNWDRQNRLQDWEVSPEFELELPGNTQLHLSVERGYELFQDLGFHKREARFFFETERLDWLSVFASGSIGRDINYYPPEGQQPFLADASELELGFTLRPRPAVRVEPAYIFSSLSTSRQPPGDSSACGCGMAAVGDSPIFQLHLVRLKANYQFTRELSLRGIFDYNGLNPNPAFMTEERDRRLTADLLVTYLLNPGTALYVGFTDAYANLRLDPRLSPIERRSGEAGTSVGRQFFVKVSYLFRW